MTTIVIFPPDVAAFVSQLRFPGARIMSPVPFPGTAELFLVKSDVDAEDYRTAWPLLDGLEIREVKEEELKSNVNVNE